MKLLISHLRRSSPMLGISGRAIPLLEHDSHCVRISNFRFHDLRHTAATRIAAAGVDPFTLAYIFGWSDIRMAMRYTHATNANMKQAVRSLDSLSARLGNVLATKTKTAGAVPP